MEKVHILQTPRKTGNLSFNMSCNNVALQFAAADG